MNTEKILSSAGETVAYAQLYLEKQAAYFQLEMTKRMAKTTSNLITLAVIAFLIFMVVLFSSIGIAMFLGKLWNAYGLAFLLVTLFYLCVGIMVFYFKKQIITNPISAVIIKSMLE